MRVPLDGPCPNSAGSWSRVHLSSRGTVPVWGHPIGCRARQESITLSDGVSVLEQLAVTLQPVPWGGGQEFKQAACALWLAPESLLPRGLYHDGQQTQSCQLP